MALDGVEIITNSSGSHFALQKLDTRLQLIMEATRKSGGVYLVSILLGQCYISLHFTHQSRHSMQISKVASEPQHN